MTETPYTDAADAVLNAYHEARSQRRPHSERAILDHALRLLVRLAREAGEEEE